MFDNIRDRQLNNYLRELENEACNEDCEDCSLKDECLYYNEKMEKR